MTRHPAAALALAGTAVLAPAAADAQALVDKCTAQVCVARLTPRELLDEIQTLIAARRFDEAGPMLAALARAPEFGFEVKFLTGYVAEQTGDYKKAASIFEDILARDPRQTRVRLELGRTLLAMGRPQSADKQFRLAQADDELPPDIARTLRSVRTIIRSKRAWSLNFDVGLAPDSNINNATTSDTVTVLFGAQPIPLTLNQEARARSGIGRTATIEAGLRLPVGKRIAIVADVDALGADYDGTAFDDYTFEGAAGSELKVSDATRMRIQGVVAERLYGARIASRQYGVKLGADTTLGATQRLGLQIDARRTDARFDANYDGWQVGAYATYERVVAKSMIASATLYVRRDWLRAPAYSSVEAGGMLGLGGELPWGFNFAVSAGASRASYDAPIALFSLDPRRDWRFNGRLAIGNRAIRVLGFSPSISVSYGRIDSSLDFYASSRVRARFALARYF
ncbi:surface lipoprotein assembly modifier [uncultured Sphingomonas sp.]|uniref:surface lipoprotein assembly modifier n=1 Tax=uncultured Sphingomonas sp. TaxID=158754 RepID=UPI0035C94D78